MAFKGFMDWVKGEDVESDFDDYPRETTRAESRETTRAESREPARTDYREARESRAVASTTTSAPSYSEPERRTPSRATAPANMNLAPQLAVVLVKPDVFEKAADIADHLKDRRTVVLNLEKTKPDISRRLIDFLSGVAYANEGKIKRVASSTYIITPYNVDLMGEVLDELSGESSYM